jgi:hypothetical protein
MIIPFTLALAISGMVSKLVYPETEVYFFPILIDMGKGWQLLVAIVIASLASSVADSIQIGMAAELVTNFRGLTLAHARLVCGEYIYVSPFPHIMFGFSLNCNYSNSKRSSYHYCSPASECFEPLSDC